MLEEEVIPAYYDDRDEDGVPRRWMHMMKELIATLGPAFGASRMVEEYTSKYYLPAHRGSMLQEPVGAGDAEG